MSHTKATIATGLPGNKVLAQLTGPTGASDLMISALPPNAPTGNPPPMIFPNVVRSSITP